MFVLAEVVDSAGVEIERNKSERFEKIHDF
jgi:hypothetical protein